MTRLAHLAAAVAAVLALAGCPDDQPKFGCGDFDTQDQAQRAYDDHPDDWAHLDRDGDGVACEDLP